MVCKNLVLLCYLFFRALPASLSWSAPRVTAATVNIRSNLPQEEFEKEKNAEKFTDLSNEICGKLMCFLKQDNNVFRSN